MLVNTPFTTLTRILGNLLSNDYLSSRQKRQKFFTHAEPLRPLKNTEGTEKGFSVLSVASVLQWFSFRTLYRYNLHQLFGHNSILGDLLLIRLFLVNWPANRRVLVGIRYALRLEVE